MTKRRAAKPKSTKPATKSSLVKRAKEALRQSPRKLSTTPNAMADMQRLMHELQVHQVELELQNEELRKTQIEADEARARYADLYEFAPVGYFTLKDAGAVLEANLNGSSMLGHDRRHILRRPFAVFLDEPSRRGFRAAYSKAIKTAEQQTVELALTNGKHALAVLIKCRPEDSDPACVRMALMDTTEKKTVEEALRKAEARFQSVVQGIKDYAIYTLDSAGHVTSWNEGAERMMQYQPSEITGKHFSEFYPEADRKNGRPTRLQAAAVATGRAADQGWQLRRDGSLFWADTVLTALKDENGAVHGFVKVKRDFTERMLADQQRQQSHEQLQDLAVRLQQVREEERTRIAHEIHDELGQALTGLKLDIAWIKGQLADSSPGLQDKLADMSNLADSTIQSVRDVATELRPVVLDQLGLLPAMEWWAEQFETRTGLRCKLNFFLRQVALAQDQRTAMFRIFQEVLTNIARHANASVVTVTVKESTGMLVLEVSDNGRGITQAELADPKSLGLAGIRHRASLFQGEVSFVGNPGRGTTVTLTWPLARTMEELEEPS